MTEYSPSTFIAANLLKSWLKATGIECQYVERTQPLLRVGGLTVLVSEDNDDTFLTVSPKDILSRNRDTALQAFWKVTDTLGESRQLPFQRGQEPVGVNGEMAKASYKDDVFVAAIRSADFRRAPNPGSEQWKRYDKIVKNACAKFNFVNRTLCHNHGLELDDILQYGRCYLVNFCAKYEIPMAQPDENEKLFNVYIWQRLYGDLHRVLKKSMEGDTIESTWINFDEAIDDSSYLFRNDSPEDRAQEIENAKDHLEERLASMEHSKLLESIKNVMETGKPGIKGAATKLLKTHLDSCSMCRIEENEHVAES